MSRVYGRQPHGNNPEDKCPVDLARCEEARHCRGDPQPSGGGPRRDAGVANGRQGICRGRDQRCRDGAPSAEAARSPTLTEGFVDPYLKPATEAPAKITGDLGDLRAIHRHLFQDVYEWAGQVRTVDIDRNESAPFLPVSFIVRAAAFCTEELRRDGMLRELSRDGFIARLAYHYDAVNHIHPFREGNGRTQWVFWSQIAVESGDLAPMREMLDQIVRGTLWD
jgi:Fic/DOC family